MPVSSAKFLFVKDFNQFDIEDKSFVGADFVSGTVWSIRDIRWNKQSPF